VAHQSVKTAKAIHHKSTAAISSIARVFGNALVEEKKVAAHKLAVLHFSDEVNALRDSTERLDVRLSAMEEKFK
jgi:ubiquinone biosynthesis protein UbiJ